MYLVLAREIWKVGTCATWEWSFTENEAFLLRLLCSLLSGRSRVAGHQPRGQALLLIHLTTCDQIINLNIRRERKVWRNCLKYSGVTNSNNDNFKEYLFGYVICKALCFGCLSLTWRAEKLCNSLKPVCLSWRARSNSGLSASCHGYDVLLPCQV